MAFGRDVCQFANQLRNTCHGRLVNGTVLALIDGHDHHHENIVLNPIHQPIALLAEFDFVVTFQRAMQLCAWSMRIF